MAFPVSPDTDNYRIGTGIVYFTEEAEGATRRDLGECPNFKVTPDITEKEHKSSRGGTKTVDVSSITEVKKTVDFELEEVTAENMRYFDLADIDTDTDGNLVLNGLTNTQIIGLLEFEGDNDVGQKVKWEGRVQFVPSGAFNYLEDGDDYTKIVLRAKVLKSEDGSYGKTTFPVIA